MADHAPFAHALTFLSDAPCGLLQTDSQGVILWANPLFCTWVGGELADIVEKRKVHEYFTPGGRIFHLTHWVPLLQLQNSVSEVKFDIVRADGQAIPMIMNAVRVQRDSMIVHNIAFFVARDRDQYERELVKAGERLKTVAARAAELEVIAKDRAMFAEQMMAIVSHDLRSPLSTIDLSALALAAGGLGGSQQAAVGRITRATARAVLLIHDLLDFTQARLGKGMRIVRCEIDLHTVMSDGIEELRAAFPGRELQHHTQGAGGCAVDADRLQQLVGNLVTNAFVYGSHGTPVVVTSHVTDGACSISVHNMGPPIDAESIASLFEPMTRGPLVSDGTRSVGLGLYIVREIAKAHGGNVTVTSNLSDGTTFVASFKAAIPVT